MVSYQLVIDCAAPERMARFWAGALRYTVEPPPGGFDTWRDYWRSIGVPEDELLQTKEMSKGRIVMGLEDSRSVASWIGGQELTFGVIKTPEEVMEDIDSVRADAVLDLAREMFREDRLNLALIGPYDDAEHFLSLLKL